MRRLTSSSLLCPLVSSFTHIRDAPSTSAAAATTSASSLCPRRHVSQQCWHWLSRLHLGNEEGPFFGEWVNSLSEDVLSTRQQYCKALVYSSGGGRLSRDWIAGCAAVRMPDRTLLHIALQYIATEADVLVLKEMLLERLLSLGDEDDVEEANNENSGNTASSSTMNPAAAAVTSVHMEPTSRETQEAEAYILGNSPEVRCFLYDSMCAALFHCHADMSALREARNRLQYIGGEIFHVPDASITALWKLVEAEAFVKREKARLLGQYLGE